VNVAELHMLGEAVIDDNKTINAAVDVAMLTIARRAVERRRESERVLEGDAVYVDANSSVRGIDAKFECQRKRRQIRATITKEMKHGSSRPTKRTATSSTSACSNYSNNATPTPRHCSLCPMKRTAVKPTSTCSNLQQQSDSKLETLQAASDEKNSYKFDLSVLESQ